MKINKAYTIVCVECGSLKTRYPSYAKRKNKKGPFCSKPCHLSFVRKNALKYKIDKNGCWLWERYLTKAGYGQLKFERKTILAHRLSWEIKYGEIPENLCICHKCDVRSCVNPEHLFIGTHVDNMKDRNMKGRAKGLKGENHNKAKLSNKDVLYIRKNKLPKKALAKIFKVSNNTIKDIISKRTWKHI